MKHILIIISSLVIFTACATAPQPAANQQTAPATDQLDKSLVATSRATPPQAPQSEPAANAAPPSGSAPKSKWKQAGDPIDTTKFDADIEKAEKAHKQKPADAATKKALADAYFVRGSALTEARQYASAIGDYRRCIKLDPDNKEAKGWIEQIEMIYNSINREFPKEGEEPPPLPFKKTV
jgi:tetratricopeptide (TPR) repeat protein